jgi:hypothetical protein
MEKTDLVLSTGQKRCCFCKRPFTPHPKVKDRQYACCHFVCQRIRQKRNHIDWLGRHPVDYKDWYQDYGKAWNQNNPDYQRQYRHNKKMTKNHGRSFSAQALKTSLRRDKKEELTSVTIISDSPLYVDKKEELTNYFYLIKARDLEFFSLRL